MSDAIAMRLIQGAGKLNPILQHLGRWQRTFFQTGRESRTLHEFHDDIVGTVLPADVVERADMRMVQAGYDLGLAFEALTARRIVREMRRENLDGDSSVEARVQRLVDFAHSACADRRNNLVRAKLRARGQRHELGKLYRVDRNDVGENTVQYYSAVIMSDPISKRSPNALLKTFAD